MIRTVKDYLRTFPVVVLFLITALFWNTGCSRLRNDSSLSSGSCEASDCHSFTVLQKSTPDTGKHAAHLSAGLDCGACHDQYLENRLHKNGTNDRYSGETIVFFNKVNPGASWNESITSCENLSCHVNADWYGSATFGCTDCHSINSSINPILINGSGTQGKHLNHVSNSGIDCETCHSGYKSTSSHINGSLDAGNSSILITLFNSMNPSGQWTDDTGPGTGSCSSLTCHIDADWYGTAPFGCTACHYSGSAIDPLILNGSGTGGKHLKHVTERGIPCGKCHYNYKSMSTHADGSLDADNSSILITLFDSTNPSGSWTGDTGANTGSCASLACHGGSTVDWYGTGTWTLPACDTCHGAAVGTRRQVTGAGGDFNRTSHHVLDYTDPSNQLVTEADCLICHDQSGHMGGKVRLKDKDNTGTQIVYDPEDPSSLEPFCLSCHDSDGATTEGSPLSPFSSSSILGTPPYIRGLLIEDNWLKTYGHGTKGNHAPGDRLTCMGSGSPGTGCHGNGGSINAHGSVNEVIGAKEYKYSLDSGYYDETWFSLCFDCHSNYPGMTKEDTLGVKAGGNLDNEAWLNNCSSCHFSFNPTTNAFPPYYTGGVTTHFADHDEAGDPWGLNDGANPYIPMPTDNNLHWLHLGMYVSLYRGLSGARLVTCSNCHSVHGSNTPYGAVHDEMGYINVSDGNGNIYGQMKAEAYDETDGTPDYLSSYPTYCDMSCHDKTGPTRSWFSPLTE